MYDHQLKALREINMKTAVAALLDAPDVYAEVFLIKKQLGFAAFSGEPAALPSKLKYWVNTGLGIITASSGVG